MADKKITALTELSATDKRGEDFLHIIDYGGGSSPVNKKISLTNLFNNINLDSHIYGASKTLEVGFGATVNAHLTVTTGSANNADGTVTINQDGVAFVDFLVKSLNSDSALSIDAGADTVTINGDSANLDFVVNGDTVAKMLFCDASADVVGIGVAAPDTTYTLDVAATGANGIKSAGSVAVTGAISATTTATINGNTTVGITASGMLALSSVESVACDGGADNLSATVTTSLLTITAAGTGELPKHTVVGAIKVIYAVAQSTGAYVLTPQSLNGYSTITFADKSDSCILMWQTGGWVVVSNSGVALAA